MNGTRILGAVVATILASSLGTLVACNDASHDKQETIPTAQSASAASVSISILDANGAKVGSASGIMIAPRLVLTAAHALSGQQKWSVVSADGKQTVTGSRAMTYDWQQYDSSKAHPRRHDVGVIHLDAPITLDSYPKLVSSSAQDNVSATRIRGMGGATFSKIPLTLTKVVSSPNNWLSDGAANETLDTGGAVFNDSGILGVVSGRGMTTSKLYVARVDQLNSWLEAKVACAGGATGTRTYEAPVADKTTATCDDAGAGTGTSSSGSPSGSSSPNSGSGSGSDQSCSNNNEGVCFGASCGTGGSNPSTSGDDDDSSANGGGPGSNNGGGSGSGAGSNAGSSGSNPNAGNGADNGSGAGNGGGANGQNGSGSGAGSNAGSSGSNPNAGGNGSNGAGNGSASASGGNGQNGSGSGSSAGSSGSNPNSNGSGGNGSGAGNGSGGGGQGNVGGAGSNPNNSGNGEACQGASDNPETCPVEAANCKGASCGGGTPDDAIDYGNCACSGASSEGDLVVK